MLANSNESYVHFQVYIHMKQQTKTVPKMKKAPKNLTQMSFSQDQQQKLQNPNCTLIQNQESHLIKNKTERPFSPKILDWEV